MMELSGPSQPPAAGGKPKQLVVLLHGYGSNGDDLIGLAPFFAQALPEAEFLSPNAPFPCEISPMGFQWFGLEDRSPDMKLGGVRLAAEILDPFLDAELGKRGLADRDLALIGFSQGTMMSLHVGPRRANRIGGILGFSGALIGPQFLAAEMKSQAAGVPGPRHRRPGGALWRPGPGREGPEGRGDSGRDRIAPGSGPFDRSGGRAKGRPVPAPVLRARPCGAMTTK